MIIPLAIQSKWFSFSEEILSSTYSKILKVREFLRGEKKVQKIVILMKNVRTNLEKNFKY